ncbi:type I-C CRISPR-associated endonuclease Cas1c [Salinisphaera hydrothermalis]|uniref:type I-C CRISPR-associated endonuclease Cas1c n=1 Tax=Salinisphaera hydrothermalis TaxID=563188 RepID=UPI0033422855
MRRLLNTLYVTSDGAWMKKDGANIVMMLEGEERGRLPAHMIESLVCFGRVLVSPPLMAYCSEQGIAISYFTPNGRFQARVEGPVSGNVLLRRAQYRATDDPAICTPIIRHLLAGKIHNQRSVARRQLRDRKNHLEDSEKKALELTVNRLERIGRRLMETEDADKLRGLEGEAAQRYFASFSALINGADEAFTFTGRNRRPPRDRVNAALSFVYTLLTHDCRSALEQTGLDPAVGFLHRDRPGRPSLALDLAEEFRPVLADRLVLTLINRRQLKANDFSVAENGAVLLTEDGRKIVLTAYQERKREELIHPYLQEAAPLGLVPSLQAQLLARHLRGDLDAYPPFIRS